MAHFKIYKSIIAFGTALGLLIGPAVSYKRYSYVEVDYPQSHFSSVTNCEPQNAYFILSTDAMNKSVGALGPKLESADTFAQPSGSQLEATLDSSLPYIASVLNTRRVHRPKIKFIDEIYGSGRAYFKDSIDSAVLGKEFHHGSLTIPNSKVTIMHEAFHSQYLGGNFMGAVMDEYSPLFSLAGLDYTQKSKFHSNTFVVLLTLEALARQALDGDKISEFGFYIETGRLMRNLNIPEKNLTYEGWENYRLPAQIFIDIALCDNSKYTDIDFHGIMEMVKKIRMQQ